MPKVKVKDTSSGTGTGTSTGTATHRHPSPHTPRDWRESAQQIFDSTDKKVASGAAFFSQMGADRAAHHFSSMKRVRWTLVLVLLFGIFMVFRQLYASIGGESSTDEEEDYDSPDTGGPTAVKRNIRSARGGRTQEEADAGSAAPRAWDLDSLDENSADHYCNLANLVVEFPQPRTPRSRSFVLVAGP